MNVALYYPWLYLKSGAERIIAELCARSRHRWKIITNRYDPEATFPSLREADIVELQRVSVKRSFAPVAAAAWQMLWQRLPLEGQDALVVICEGLGDLVTFRNHQLPIVCLCLTPLRAAFDPHYQAEYLRRHENKWYRRAALGSAAAFFKAMDRQAWKRYDRVIAISEEVRRRIVRGRLCPESKVSVMYPGVDCSKLSAKIPADKVFLIPGRIMWTKNLALGIEAFQLLLGKRPDLAEFRLIIAGFVDQKSGSYLAALKEQAASCPHIEFIESPSDEQLLALYARAYAVLYTPFNEDFGLVILEAMALGKPLIAVNRGGPLETVVDNQTGFLREPTPQAFARAMETLADDRELAGRMSTAARSRAQQFDAARFYGALDDCLDDLHGDSPLRAGCATPSFSPLRKHQ